jgi:hypothetical protein
MPAQPEQCDWGQQKPHNLGHCDERLHALKIRLIRLNPEGDTGSPKIYDILAVMG